MFQVREEPSLAESGEKISSNVGSSILLRGDVSSDDDIRIEGQIIGSIRCNATVFVLAGGNVSANIYAESVVVNGVIRGNIQVANRIIIYSDAVLVGDVKCRQISVAEGSHITGKVETRDTLESHNKLAVEGSRLAEELDRSAELDIENGRYTTLNDPASLEELFLERNFIASHTRQRQAVVKSY